jgi:hypothetical protein
MFVYSRDIHQKLLYLYILRIFYRLHYFVILRVFNDNITVPLHMECQVRSYDDKRMMSIEVC